MEDRRYTFKEIEQMRDDLFTIRACRVGHRSYSDDVVRSVEDRLRTCLTGGLDPAELRQEAEKLQIEYDHKQAEHKKRVEEYYAEHNARRAVFEDLKIVQQIEKPGWFSSAFWTGK